MPRGSGGDSNGGTYGGDAAADAAKSSSGRGSRSGVGSWFGLGTGRILGGESVRPLPPLSVCLDLQGELREGGRVEGERGDHRSVVCDGADVVVGLQPSSEVQVGR